MRRWGTLGVLVPAMLLALVGAAAAASPPLASYQADGWTQTDVPSGSSVFPCPDWPMYGRTPARTFATDCPSAISRASVTSMAPAWTFKTPATVTASPVAVDGAVYVGDWSGTMYALDAETGEKQWATATEPAPGAAFGPIVSSAAVADVEVGEEVRRLVVFGSGPRLYALDAADGSEVWLADLGSGIDNDPTEVESSPVIWNGVVYVGRDVHNATIEESGGTTGGVLAVDATTGEVLWTFHPQGPNASGCDSVWSSPVLDLERGHVVVATGNCPHDVEWTPYVEAVVALDMADGSPQWSFQPHEPNRKDWDFGATPNLLQRRDGSTLIGAGNKDGHYYALDPATGEALWSTRVAEPGDVQQDFSIGGFIGSPAIFMGNVFGATALGGPPYMHSVAGAGGAIRWQQPLAGPSYAASAAVNGIVFTGALDDQFRAYDAGTGDILWQVPLAGPISSGPAIVGDRVFVGSGTSSSDACAKDTPVFSEACQAAFEESLGRTGAVHAFQLERPGQQAAVEGTGTGNILLGGEGNRLRAYDLDTLQQQVVIASAADVAGVEGGETTSSESFRGRDINAQICWFPDGSGRFVAGEDTSQPDPPPAWGIFQLSGAQVGELAATQLGELTPTYRSDGAENYGCGFLPDGRILTTDVGNQFPGQPATGQLIVWFPPFDRGLSSGEVAYCKIDVSIPTAGGILVDGSDVYVASARPDGDRFGGVWRYSGDWPTSDTAEGGCGGQDETDAPLVDDGRVQRELVMPADGHAMTPSGLAMSPAGTLYVSSVYDGTIAEYTTDGEFVREILRPPGLPAMTTGTPWGITIDEDGTVYYADLGIVGDGPERAFGSVRRIRFSDDGEPLSPEVLAAGLDFADGVGLVTFPSAPPVARSDAATDAAPTAFDDRGPTPTTGGGFSPLALGFLGLTTVLGLRRRRPGRG